MVNQPLVSCIIIFYNAEKFLAEAISSVLAQTYKNWELLLADDGSVDNSIAIAQKYAKEYPDQVHYVEHPGHVNRGMSATRNLGIANARGELIAFLDADDYWFPDKLLEQVTLISQYPEVAMLYGRSKYWLSWTGKPTDQNKDYIPSGYLPGRVYQPPELLIKSYPLGKATPPPPTDILLKRQAIEQLGGFEAGFQGIYQLYEDQAFFTKLYLKLPVLVSEKCWEQYRLHPDSCGSVVNKSGKYHMVRRFFLEWLEEYLSKENVQEPQVWQALQKALLIYRYPVLLILVKIKGVLVRFYQKVIGFSIKNLSIL